MHLAEGVSWGQVVFWAIVVLVALTWCVRGIIREWRKPKQPKQKDYYILVKIGQKSEQSSVNRLEHVVTETIRRQFKVAANNYTIENGALHLYADTSRDTTVITFAKGEWIVISSSINMIKLDNSGRE